MVREANERLARVRREGYNGVYVGNIGLQMNCCDSVLRLPCLALLLMKINIAGMTTT
jgi:hypothetical protein